MKTLTLGILVLASAAAQTYPVAGVVTVENGSAPLQRARVMLYDESGACHALTTGADGRFRFDVPKGKYSLFYEHNLWRLQYGSADPDSGFGSAIVTGAGQDTAHLTLRWYPPNAIYGSVADEEGEPVRDAQVELLRDSVVAGRKRVFGVRTAQTDDRGQYRLGLLAAGTYYVAVRDQPWRAAGGDGRLHAFNVPAETASGYAPIYYPGTAEFRRAEPIVLKAGAEKRADIPSIAVPAATVRVRCPGWGTDDGGCPGQARLFSQGMEGVTLESPNAVLPGRYTLRLLGRGRAASKIIDVGPGDMSVDLAPDAGFAVAGKVTFKNAPPNGGTSQIVLVDELTGETLQAEIGADGRFQLPNAWGGRFRLSLSGSSPWFIEGTSVEGASFKDGLLDLTGSAGARLNLVASGEAGRLKGFATRDDTPVPEVLVVLVPRSGSFEPLGYQTESDGSFDYLDVPAGDYLLFAVDNLDLEYANPEVTRPYLAGAMAVHIPAGGVVEQSVPLAAGAGN